ncbi:OmpA/MotB family protein [Ectothiorhodospira lacustris]|uniref:OmpA/MotB family protein n=1 Tax=Ectothiorhodospira lacustris TaxID=2899127 RepID=UPI001EE8C542|nr:OmpA family protein [Ectothiorhodospira lacustris]
MTLPPQRPVPPAPADPAGKRGGSEDQDLRKQLLQDELEAAPHFPPPWSRGSHGEPAVDRDDDQAWLLIYVDLLTLVLVLFVILLAYTTVDADSQLKLVDSLAVELGYPRQETIVPPIVEAIPPAPSPGKAERLARDLTESLAESGGLEDVDVLTTPGQVELRMREGILFASGRAELLGEGVALLSRLAPIFGPEVARVTVEGHTDNVPIATERFPSNWELSVARATVVVRHLISEGVAPERLQASGFADTKPVSDNDTLQGRAQNRRVSLVLQMAPEGFPGQE